jgi:crossover junction endodeoxyribonuclease RuvC
MNISGCIIALDLATQTGFCVGKPDNPHPSFGEFVLPSTGDDIGKFAVTFEDWLDEMFTLHKPELVVFEMPILPKMTSLITVRKLTGLAWETEQKCKRLGIKVREGRASTVKKHFTGYGHAAKADTVAIARRYGWDVKSNDAADACALWAYSVCCFADERHKERFALGPLAARMLF